MSMGLAPEPKTQKNGPRGLKPWILSFGSWVIKRTETQNKMAPAVGIPGLGMGKRPVPQTRKQDGAGRCLREDRCSK